MNCEIYYVNDAYRRWWTFWREYLIKLGNVALLPVAYFPALLLRFRHFPSFSVETVVIEESWKLEASCKSSSLPLAQLWSFYIYLLLFTLARNNLIDFWIKCVIFQVLLTSHTFVCWFQMLQTFSNLTKTFSYARGKELGV